MATIKRITCLGSGFVGGPTSAVMAFKSDVNVTVVDLSAERIAAWNSKALPIYEPGLESIVFAARDGIQHYSLSSENTAPRNGHHVANAHSRPPSLFFSTDIDQAIKGADLIFVCVNTPTKSNGVGKGAGADLSYVEAATRNIARVATRSTIVVEKSTVPCRTAQSIREIASHLILSSTQGEYALTFGKLSANARPGVHFDVLSNPEFLAEGTAVRDLLCPDRIIIGSMPTPSGSRAAASLAAIYGQWVPEDRIITMNLWSAELSKLAANAMLAQRISSVNALSAICEATGAEVEEVSYACGLDSRIGPGMLKAGPGFGGRQKDIFNIVYLSESLRLPEVASFWRAIIDLNAYQKRRFTERIISRLHNNLTGKKIAILGFAFKKNTSDTRESPAITLVTSFVAERAQVAIYDPKVKEEQIWKDLIGIAGNRDDIHPYIEVCGSAYAACDSADAVVIVTEWDEFSNKNSAGKAQNLEQMPVLSERSTNYLSGSVANHKGLENSAYFRGTARDGNHVAPGSLGASINIDRRPSVDWSRIYESMRKPSFVFDGRNILDAAKLEDLGFRVETIGRASSKNEAD
ncbi:UDP-glucose 6-dehydrogenase 1 [Lambiella insularis]|nr:UDP-glucose 6-dehydrogenase 1 [Lambiella insularis]